MMNSVISVLDGCDAYIDDLALYSGKWEDHTSLLISPRVSFVEHESCSLAILYAREK